MEQIQDMPISVLIVWEPVLWTDLSPPLTSVLSLVSDQRAVQFWDKNRALSGFMVRSVIEDPSLQTPGDSMSPDTIVWDFVAVFPPGVAWSAHARPSYYGGPVMHVMDQVRSAIPAPRP